MRSSELVECTNISLKWWNYHFCALFISQVKWKKNLLGIMHKIYSFVIKGFAYWLISVSKICNCLWSNFELACFRHHCRIKRMFMRGFIMFPWWSWYSHHHAYGFEVVIVPCCQTFSHLSPLASKHGERDCFQMSRSSRWASQGLFSVPL